MIWIVEAGAMGSPFHFVRSTREEAVKEFIALITIGCPWATLLPGEPVMGIDPRD